MNILFLGDSITEGSGASSPDKGYVALVGERLGCRTVNYGIGGTRIARQTGTSDITLYDIDFRTRVPLMESEADFVFIFGGTNDYGHGDLHLGTPDSGEEKTFCYHLRLLIEDLLKKYCKRSLCFILPPHRFCEEPITCKGENGNERGASLSEYLEAMREILSEYEVDYIDLYEKGFPKPLTDKGDDFTADGLHPNDRGHALIADLVCEYIAEKLTP